MSAFEARLDDILRDISYKDWNFNVGKDAIGLYYLQVQFSAFDAQSAAHSNWNGRKWRLSMHMTKSEIVQTALKAVLAAEEHEAREGFRYMGRAIFGPHLHVDMLWHLAGKRDALDQREDHP